MIALDHEGAPPGEAVPLSESDDGLRHCTLCVSLQPAHEMVQINPRVSATQIAVAADGLIGAIVGTSAGIVLWAVRAMRGAQ
jgi:hypothetical protein